MQSSPLKAYVGALIPSSLSLMWDWGGANSFDVDIGSTEKNVFPLRLQFRLGKTPT